MENLKGKTAFITGGASGMGLGTAKACAREGMNVVIADMRQDAIGEALEIFKENAWPAIGIKLNTADREAYVKAADQAKEAFGNIHLLFNNAGISCKGGPLWSVTGGDTDLAVGVNLIGVLNGIQIIVPHMIEHGEGGHIVSTASKAALLPVPYCGLYNVTKAAVVAVMETLAMDLAGTNIGASAFCPGGYITNLGASSQAVMSELQGTESGAPAPEEKAGDTDARPRPDFTEVLRPADEAGERVIRGVKRGDLYILTHSEFKKGVESRFNAISKAFPDEEPNPRYDELLPMLTYNSIFDTQTQVPAMK